ncbi:hypothetical protein DEU56DRAFT_535067 [Suillus clintonianus]|uniref:uncharacterized protein n=1 Tax=Suillus clintonianus TaxID=1904413 RepID=UPI001B8730CA|nr:uncharacterized protein DEU56DRAFT_535067 [Suillus clintonianus]KAG2126936.1 hypothetical protein DEU56DRAFT_535067 [Suillus clintonianus]
MASSASPSIYNGHFVVLSSFSSFLLSSLLSPPHPIPLSFSKSFFIMRLSSFAVPVLSASTAFALSKNPPPWRRALVHDVCGSLKSDLILNEIIDSQGRATVAGHIEACLCLSDVVKFVESNVAAQAAVKLLGNHGKVEALISGMVKGLSTGSHCSYPDHARALCTDSNPCDFECIDGYLAFPPEKPTSCKCPDHLMECNGKCGHFKECPSEAPLSRRNSEPQCAAGRTMCGIPGTTTGQPWKCVDVKTDTTTCGGCLKAAPFGKAPVTGENCKDIKGVIHETVTCGNGRCIVKDCAEGFFVAPAMDTCIPIPKSATAGSKQQSEATIPGSSGSTGSTEGLKVSRDKLTAALKHGAGIAIAPLGDPVSGLKTPRDVTGGIQNGAAVVVKPLLGATEGLAAGGSAGPAGVLAGVVQGAKVVSPVAGAVEATSAGFKVTRDVAGGLPRGAGVAPIVGAAKSPAAGPFAGIHGIRGVEGGLIHGIGASAKDNKAVAGTTAAVHAA